LAGFSFSLYVFHVPIILCLRATKLYDPKTLFDWMVGFVAILGTVYFLALGTEQKKAAWQLLLDRLYSRISNLFGFHMGGTHRQHANRS
jgi:hypothetical protein